MANDLISIVILTRNAGESLEQTLGSILEQETDSRVEVVVVDSGSTDGTLEVLRSFNMTPHEIAPNDFNFGLTRNLGFSLAAGAFIVTISQDVVPSDPHWLSRMIAPFYGDESVVAVQGGTQLPQDADVFYWERLGWFYFTSEAREWGHAHGCGLSFVNCAIRRSFWEQNQLEFVPHSEDKVFQKKIHDAGRKVFRERDALCYHGHQYSLISLVRRLTGEGLGWRYVSVSYSLADCLRDIYKNKWLIRRSLTATVRGEITTIQEFLFPLLRPLCIWYGNKWAGHEQPDFRHL